MIYIHPGYPKAGSTTLQKQLFAKHSDLINLGIYPTANIGQDSGIDKSLDIPFLKDARLKNLYRQLTQSDGILYDSHNMSSLWEEISQDYADNKRPLLLSSESLLSALFSNPEIKEKARRLQGLFNKPKIIIVIRSQVDLLRSIYRDHPVDPRTISYKRKPVSFSQWLNIDLALPHHSITNTLLFQQAVELYEDLFGTENILVLPLELLAQSPSDFTNSLSEFMNIDADETFRLLNNKRENTGISATGNRYRKLRMRLMPLIKTLRPFKRHLRSIDRTFFKMTRKVGNSQQVPISQEDMRIINEKYASDNMRLAHKHSLPLQDLGYPFPEHPNT